VGQREDRPGADRNTENCATQTLEPGTAADLVLEPIDVQGALPVQAAKKLPRAARFEVIDSVIDTRI
jgi:hypothetical protein